MIAFVQIVTMFLLGIPVNGALAVCYYLGNHAQDVPN